MPIAAAVAWSAPMWIGLLAALASSGAHFEHMQTHPDVVPLLERVGFARGKDAVTPKTFTRTVYAYLPYWSDSGTDIPWEFITHLSYFGVAAKADGSLGDDHAWDTGGANLVDVGHSYGVKVTLTAFLMDDDSIDAVLKTSTTRNKLIDNLLDAVAAQGGDGVNIDFEGLPYARKADFVTFVTDLTTAFHAAMPGSHVSLATPAVDWEGAFDYDQLAISSDGLMIMGYGYHWSGGNPGPNAPIATGTTWGGKSLTWTIEDYITWGLSENRDKFVLGLPLYGLDWPTTSTAVPGTKTGSATSKWLYTCDSFFAANGKSWDADSQTPYKTYVSNAQPRQLWCDDEASMEAKFNLINDHDLGGVMFWALGYAKPGHYVWDHVDAEFTLPPPVNTPPVATANAPATVDLGQAIWLDGSESSDPDGETLTYAWAATEGPAVAIVDANGSVALVYPQVVGTYVFTLTVSDASDSATASVTIEVVEPADDSAPPPDDGGVGPDDDGGDDGPATDADPGADDTDTLPGSDPTQGEVDTAPPTKKASRCSQAGASMLWLLAPGMLLRGRRKN